MHLDLGLDVLLEHFHRVPQEFELVFVFLVDFLVNLGHRDGSLNKLGVKGAGLFLELSLILDELHSLVQLVLKLLDLDSLDRNAFPLPSDIPLHQPLVAVQLGNGLCQLGVVRVVALELLVHIVGLSLKRVEGLLAGADLPFEVFYPVV